MDAKEKKREWAHLRFQWGLSVIVLQFFLCTDSVVNCTQQYNQAELDALQVIFGAWNTSTPDLSSNLAGWNSTQIYPCSNLNPRLETRRGIATDPQWRGVQCLNHCYSNSSDCDVNVIGLSISNASIVGILPPEVGNLSFLTVLELTGNPGLYGPLPESITFRWINVLDVHDNGFNGTFPNLHQLWNLLQLDLSGNQFTGGYPDYELSWMAYLQILNINNNRLTGEIQAAAFENKAELEKLDISDNHFTGTLPDLNYMQKLIHLDVSGNQFDGPLPDLRKFSTLRTVNLGRNRFTGTANLLDIFNLTASTTLTTVDMSNNRLTGLLPSWNASNLGSIQELYLDNNTLSGTLNISHMLALGLLQDEGTAGNLTKKLRIMSLSNNSITHVIFDKYIIENITTVFKLQGNPYCTDKYDSSDDGQRCFCTQICFITPAKSDRRKIAIIASVISVVAVVTILLVVMVILLKNRRYKQYLLFQFEQKFEEFDVKPTIFPYNELRTATRNFHEDMKLGMGGYGAVYKGVLSNGNMVAVKQLFIKTAKGLDEFLNEVVLITGMKHRNLVNLKGCCLREHQRLLVYEYVDNFDVAQVLLGPRRQVVSWPVRLKICLGIARGLHYLHELAHPRVIHRDIKASNVLLDRNMEPKIADFGLALLFPDEESHIMTVHVAGTKGYLAPEYATLGQLSDKVDVYSFGVLCLEIISGRGSIDETRSLPLDEVYLSKWAWNLHDKGRVMELVDPALRLSHEEARDVERVINASLLCIQTAAERRPTMARVVSILQGDADSEVQVTQGAGKSERSYEPLMSKGSMNWSGLQSVTEEGSSSNNYLHKLQIPSRRGAITGDVELGTIGGR